ncbi:MAG: glycerophosphoryl diester phosphodiesterase membrane domain-containing protein, partial [Candidatus Staskawiczbacteria bacterium]|nr:glycerophosphoryl diester phosphodiesterase membrane domain-containing protein [Candidatus Staskawiczbacteria bacterium]
MENTNIHPKNLMSSKEIMKLARKFYKENFKKLWPLYILGGLGGMGFSYKSSSGNSTYNPLPNFNIPLQVWILIGVIFIAIYIFLFISKIALLKSISDTSKEQFVGVKDSYKKGFAIFWSFILITIMISLSVLGAFALLIIPGIILSVYLSFGTYELIDKQKKGFQALLGSWSLVRGRWWTFFGKTIMIGLRIFLTGLIYFTAISILALILIVPGIGSHVPALLIIGISLGVLAYLYLFFVFLIPLTIIAMFELYYNFCDVKESDKVADEALDKKRKRKLIISMVIGVVASIFIILAILVMFYSAKQPGGTTNYSDESISSFINREVDRAKNNISLPRKNSETTTLTDITAEPNAVRFHMVHNNISYD